MNKLNDFFLKFFNNLGCAIVQGEDTLIISNIPANFEKFSGKKGPYALSFDKEREGFELVNQNHYLLKAIKEFLEGRGETTLLKMDFNPDFKEELQRLIPFRNTQIKTISKTIENDFIFKFSFLTVFQYLNEKENVITDMYTRNSEIINFNEHFSLKEGNKREVGEINLEKDYALAKEKLKELTSVKTKELGVKLNSLLKKEIERIKEHYGNNTKEISDQEENLRKQIELCKENKEVKGKEELKRKRLERTLESLKEEKNLEKIKEEENSFIQNEIKKHGLSVNNKLINTAIIYFPIYKLNLMLEIESNKTLNPNNKIIEITYDPVKGEISPLYCQSCSQKVNELILCSSGHISCKNCLERCGSCNELTCKKCLPKKCASCGTGTCSECTSGCNSCRKSFCKSHINNLGGRKLCNNCIKRCSKCNSVIDSRLSLSSSGETLCLNCSNQKVKRNVIGRLFE